MFFMNYKTLGVFTTALMTLSGVHAGQSVHFFSQPAFAQSKTDKQKTRAEALKFLKVLKTERNQWERAQAAKWLGILADPIALDQLHASLVSDTSPQVRINSANAIARINQKSSVKKLLQAIAPNRGKTDVQLSIIRALGNMRKNSLEVVPVMVNFLKSPSPHVREATVEALWKIGDLRVAPILNKLMEKEEDLSVKMTLAKVLPDFKNPASLAVLEKVAARTNENLDVKALARDAVDKMLEMGIGP